LTVYYNKSEVERQYNNLSAI